MGVVYKGTILKKYRKHRNRDMGTKKGTKRGCPVLFSPKKSQ